MSPTKPPASSGVPTDKEIHALLLRHRCPTPLYAVRTLLLGAIASPRLEVSPMTTLAQAWGGELPEFGSSEFVADELINKTTQSCKRARSQQPERMATVMSKKFGATAAGPRPEDEVTKAPDDEADFIESPLSQSVTRSGLTVKVEIYGDSKGGWILEIVDAENASHVWDESFGTDQLALSAALQALDEEPLEFFGRASDQLLN